MIAGGVERGGGVSGFGIAEEEETPLSGTGGAAGPGTRAGEGDPSGEGTDDSEKGLAARDDHSAAREAAALGGHGDHDATPALEYGEGDRPSGPTIGEAIGSGVGTDVGSGIRPDHSGLDAPSPSGS